ncbi:hypothetical protein T11_3850 [Trichinella zimbabwensis]|uniref:Uncharacterized protein n=1 Tax=Trichinella zimbabwensis TaxID=268475 RepID=A0A0V1HSD6_9BILA|nr:hypothetical protein T11_3850 [Trichinella zimbabwensis]
MAIFLFQKFACDFISFIGNNFSLTLSVYGSDAISIAKSPIRRLPSNRPIREKQRDFPLTVAVRNKATSGRNCIKFDAVRG